MKFLGLKGANLLSVLLRLASMGAKLLLTLYMGRYLPLDELGGYGLVAAAVMIFGPLLGQQFMFVVMRDIVGIPAVDALHKMRDQALLYGANYCLLAVAVAVTIQFGWSSVSPRILWLLFILTVLEGYGTITYYNMNSLHQQIWANALVSVRSGLWVVPVIGLGLVWPSMRRLDVVLTGWAAGSALSLVATVVLWRGMPWSAALFRPVDWLWLRQGLKICFPVWLGAVGLIGGSYVDRFVVERFLPLSDVGVITFYGSFTNALLALMQSGVTAFATPTLIQFHRDGQIEAFQAKARQAVRQVVAGAGGGAVALAAAVPLLGMLTGHQVFADHALVLWLMLVGTCLRAVADMVSNILYALRRDKAIWCGNLLFLVPAIGGNALLVPMMGLNGVGLSTIMAHSLLLAWRWWALAGPDPQGGAQVWGRGILK